MGATTILILTLLAGDPARMVAGYFPARPSAPAAPANADQFPAPDVLLALPLPADRSATANYPILLEVDELEALYAKTRQVSLLYEIARKYQQEGSDLDAEANFRAYLARAPYLDPYHDAAWDAVVAYTTDRQAAVAAAIAARARALVPEPMAVMLAAVGGGW